MPSLSPICEALIIIAIELMPSPHQGQIVVGSLVNVLQFIIPGALSTKRAHSSMHLL